MNEKLVDSIPVLVIAGPTATGKTQTALKLARHFHGELIGADSVQVYRGFDIGSSKPTREELDGIKHHLIDTIDPSDFIDAAIYAQLATKAIEDVSRKNRLPIVVGGTGLWLRALLRGLVEVPPVDAALRARLENEADHNGVTALHERLRTVDPLSASKIHPHDKRRIVRALEVFEQTGRPLGQLRVEHDLGKPKYNSLFIVIDLPSPILTEKITYRTYTMLESGWIEEVRRLAQQYDDKARAFESVGYKEVYQCIRGELPENELATKIIQSTRKYARRQRTWFKNDPGVDWYTTADDVLSDNGLNRIRAWKMTSR